ncbi:hypothetical protein G9F71_022520 [Clostridium sp. FP2]|uniref:hypothetical protein n=1 Tax=Clostridium sp. FP2 TaxID=2724481 RepID=UPI0013E957CC|nr:hypothetical protein [Clostridium sp. FP2]MBZ9625607.1 hypothetical protein [Clostridium sp. FP2]
MKNKQLILLILSFILSVVCISRLNFGVYTKNGLLIWIFSFSYTSSIIQSRWIGKRYKKLKT